MADTQTSRRTNEVAGTRAILRNYGTSAYKVREVLKLINGKDVAEALDILRFSNRAPAEPIAKLLNSAIANARENDSIEAEELFVASCYADEGVTAKRWRPKARGRAGRIRKRSSHITIIVSRLPEDRLERLRASQDAQGGGRGRRVANSRAARVAASTPAAEEVEPTEDDTTVVTADENASVEAPETATAASEATEVEVTEATTDETAAEGAEDAASEKEGK